MSIKKLDEPGFEGWWVYHDEHGVEKLRFKPPEGGMDAVDWERFREHLMKLARDNEMGPN